MIYAVIGRYRDVPLQSGVDRFDASVVVRENGGERKVLDCAARDAERIAAILKEANFKCS